MTQMSVRAPRARIVTLEEITGLVDREAIISAVSSAFVAHARGEVSSPMPGQLIFPEKNGECHIKYGAIKTDGNFVIKIATGFYNNGALNLPVNDGCVLVLSSETGQLQSIFLDEGWLTAWRTAAAGCVASLALARSDIDTITIVGTGHQARLQGQWLAEAFPRCKVLIAGRSATRAEELAATLRSVGVRAEGAVSIEAAVRVAGLIVTLTASHSPLFDRRDVRPGTHITAMGSDTPGKQELESGLLADAALIAFDDRAQCLDHGELGWGVRQGRIDPGAGVALGSILEDPSKGRARGEDITIADLTGIAAQDIAIASFFMKRLGSAASSTAAQLA